MDIREEFIKEKGYSYFNNTVLNEYAIWLEEKITEIDKAFKLQQDVVIKSVCIRHSYEVKHKDLIPVKVCKKCGHVK